MEGRGALERLLGDKRREGGGGVSAGEAREEKWEIEVRQSMNEKINVTTTPLLASHLAWSWCVARTTSQHCSAQNGHCEDDG